MPWDKIIDRKVKSSDNEDMGKVESIATSYIEVKEGTVHKKHYFVPKYYIQEFDGGNLRVSLTMRKRKDRYERDSPPTESEFQTQEYIEQKRKVESTYPQFLHGTPFMAKESGVNLRHYYIPKSYINNYDESSVYVAAPNGLVSAKFERETKPTPEDIRMLANDAPPRKAS